MHVPMFDVGDIRIHHESDQVENEIGAFPQDSVGREAEVFESGIMRRLCTTHAIHHLFAYFHLRWKWFGVATENVTKINCGMYISKDKPHNNNTIQTMEEMP